MSPVLTIFRKELRSYVMTPYGWVILAFVMALQSVSLSGTLKAFQLAPQKEGILFFILHSPMFWFYFLFSAPLAQSCTALNRSGRPLPPAAMCSGVSGIRGCGRWPTT